MKAWNRRTGALAAVALTGLIGGVSAVDAQEPDEYFDRLSDNVKIVVIEVNERLGGLDAACDLALEERGTEINRTVDDLTQRDALTGAGFFALDAGNYYNTRCRDR
jgi:hypothetical protein